MAKEKKVGKREKLMRSILSDIELNRQLFEKDEESFHSCGICNGLAMAREIVEGYLNGLCEKDNG